MERVKHDMEVREICITVNGKFQCVALTFTIYETEVLFIDLTINKHITFNVLTVLRRCLQFHAIWIYSDCFFTKEPNV